MCAPGRGRRGEVGAIPPWSASWATHGEVRRGGLTCILGPLTLGESAILEPAMMRPDPEDARILGATSEDASEPCVLGRPPIGPKVSTRITVEQLAQIERLAADAGWTRAEALRYVMGWGLAVILRPPQEHGDLRAAVEAQAAAQGLCPAEMLGSAWAGVAKRGGK